MKHYFLLAGETSGDLHGSHLIKALKQQHDLFSFSGVGGPHMREAGIDLVVPMEQFQVMGLTDVLKALPRLRKLFYRIRQAILDRQPDAVILIDYPGFNLRLAKSLRKKGYRGKIVQYICPTVWAHGKKRIDALAAHYNLLLTIFPFEADYFSHTSLSVQYIGNPLVTTIHEHSYHKEWRQDIGIPLGAPLIALFPGSRQGEIDRHLSQQLHVASQLKKRYPDVYFALSCAQDAFQTNIKKAIQDSNLLLDSDFFMIPSRYRYELMQECQMALAKSGTVTLELALHRTPTVVHYQLSQLNYLFAKYALRVNLPYYCIVNVLKQQQIFPEFIGKKISLEALSEQMINLYHDQEQQKRIKKACEEIKEILSSQHTHQRAAQAILEILSC